MNITNYIKMIAESINEKEGIKETEDSYSTFVTSLDQLAENKLNEGDAFNVDYIALENSSPLGKIAFNLLQKFLIQHGGNKIDSAQFCSCKSMKKLLSSLKIEFKDDIDKWMNSGDKGREPHAVLQTELKHALQDNSTCFVIMHIKDSYNPDDYDTDTQDSDNQASAKILNSIMAATNLTPKKIPSGLLLRNGSQYIIAAF